MIILTDVPRAIDQTGLIQDRHRRIDHTITVVKENKVMYITTHVRL